MGTFQPYYPFFHGRGTSPEACLTVCLCLHVCVFVCFFLWPVSSVPCPSPTSPYASLSSCALTVSFVSFDSPPLSSFSHHPAIVDTIKLTKKMAHQWGYWPVYGEENKNHQNHNSTFFNILEFKSMFTLCYWHSQNKHTEVVLLRQKKGIDTESYTGPLKTMLLVKASLNLDTSSFSHTALYPYHLGEGWLLAPLRFLVLLKCSSLKPGLKKIDYIKPLGCKQDSIYPEVICPVVWRKAFFFF